MEILQSDNAIEDEYNFEIQLLNKGLGDWAQSPFYAIISFKNILKTKFSLK